MRRDASDSEGDDALSHASGQDGRRRRGAAETQEADALALDKPQFDPRLYIRTEHAEVSFSEFTDHVLPEIEERETDADAAIKKLVQSHLSIFIACKDSMDNLYEKEKSLFDGRAIQETEERFEEVIRSAQTTTHELIEFFEKVKQVRRSQETLEKLMSVLRVAGEVYRHCGARVLRVDTAHKKSNASGAESGDEDEEDSDSMTERSSSLSSSNAAEPSAGLSTMLLRQLQRHEELVKWFGVPLARRKLSANASHGRQDGDSSPLDFDSASQSLRVAISFLEDHYDLVTGRTLFSEEETEPEQCIAKEDQHRSPARSERSVTPARSGTSTPAADPQCGTPLPTSGLGDGSLAGEFVFCLGRSLLCAGLYLNEALHEALEATAHSDAVRVEHYLSLMMDASISTVKLRHLCVLLREELLRRTDAGNALRMLQDALEHRNVGEQRDGDASDTASEMSTARSASFKAASEAPSGAASEASGPAESAEARASLRKQHPVEAYLESFREQHNVAIVDSAQQACSSAESVSWRSETRLRRASSVSLAGCGVLGAVGLQPHASGSLVDSFSIRPSPTRSPGADVPSKSSALMSTISLASGTSAGLRDKTALSATPEDALRSFHDDVTRDVIREHQPRHLMLPSSSAAGDTEKNIVLNRTVSLRLVVESSADALIDHALQLAARVKKGEDSITTIMATVDGPRTPLLAFLTTIMRDVEHRISAYWRGVGCVIHSGAFDYVIPPEDPLHRALSGRALDVSALSAVSSDAVLQTPEEALAALVPPVRFVPLSQTDNQPSTDDADNESPPRSAAPPDDDASSLRRKSVNTVKRMLESTTAIVTRVLNAFGRHFGTNSLLLSLLGGGPACCGEDAEVKLAIALEVAISHVHSVLLACCDTFATVKTSVGETARRELVTTDAQANAITEVLQLIEGCRHEVFVASLFAMEMITKVFVLANTAIVHSAPRSAGGLHCRLGRRFVSTALPVVVFNALLVFVDRAADGLQRYSEVFRGLEIMFSNPTEQSHEGPGQRKAKGSNRRRNSSATEKDGELPPAPKGPDPIAAAVAHYNAQLALQSVSQHEELIQQSFVSVLSAFIDACLLRCHQQAASAGHDEAIDPRDSTTASLEVECLADLLSVSSVLAPLAGDTVLASTLFPLVTRLAQYNGDASGKMSSKVFSSTLTSAEEKEVASKVAAFQQSLCPALEEQVFVGVEAVLHRVVSAAQAELSRLVLHDGLVVPLLDWADAWAGSGGILNVRVRQYLPDCLIVAATLQESLAALHVPAIGFCAIMRLGAFLANQFVSAVSCSGGGVFEYSPDQSPAFFVCGVLLLETEGSFLHSALKSVADASVPLQRDAESSGDASRVKEAYEDLTTSLESLGYFVASLGEQGTAACDLFSKSQRSTGQPSFEIPSAGERKAARDAGVKDALESSRLVVDALSSFVDAAAAAMASGTKRGVVKTSLESILDKRRSSYVRAPALAGPTAASGGLDVSASGDKDGASNRLAARFSRASKTSRVKISEPGDEAENNPLEAGEMVAADADAVAKKRKPKSAAGGGGAAAGSGSVASAAAPVAASAKKTTKRRFER